MSLNTATQPSHVCANTHSRLLTESPDRQFHRHRATRQAQDALAYRILVLRRLTIPLVALLVTRIHLIRRQVKRSSITLATSLPGLIVALTLHTAAHGAVGRTMGSGDVSTSGEAQYSIPIFAPAGTNGLTPKIALSYGHRKGESLAGVGWGISGLSEITRCAKTVAQNGSPDAVKLTMDDRFCLDGNQLMRYAGTYGVSGTTYRTEVDLMARITSIGTAGNGPSWFRVESKDGLIYEYGNTADSRIESLAIGYETTARTWALSKIADRSGNEVHFYYIDDGAPFGDYRIDKVEYRVNVSAGLSAAGYRIDFVYQDQPPGDVDTEYAAGGLVEDAQRLERIDAVSLFPSPTVLRSYHLTYEVALSSTRRSRLQSIEECAWTQFDCLPETTFTYQDGSNDLDAAVASGSSIPNGAEPLALDINGDGRTDMVFPSSSQGGYWHYRLANTTGGYGPVIPSSISSNNHEKAIPFDYNGDGTDDILVPYAGNNWWVIQGSSGGLQPQDDTGAPAVSEPGNAIGMDMDGDGRQDLVWGENIGFGVGNAKIWVRYCEESGGFSTSPTLIYSTGPVEYIVGSTLFDSHFKQDNSRQFDVNGDGYKDIAILVATPDAWAYSFHTDVILGAGKGVFDGGEGNFDGLPIDMNGDGYTDLVFNNGGSAFLFSRISTGKEFAPKVTGPSSQNLDFGRAVVMDWNVDGFEDLLIPNTSTMTWYYVRSLGTSFATPVNTFVPTSDPQLVYRIDANGDGLDDVGFVASNGEYKYLPHAGVAPDLLGSVTDGNGNSIDFSYLPLTDSSVYEKYTTAQFPEQDYAGSVHVVDSATHTDGIGGTYTVSYSYAGALLNFEGRGISGFDKVTTTDSRNGMRVREYFRRHFPYRGRMYKRELLQADNTLIQTVMNVWESLSDGLANETYYFPYLYQTFEKNYEVGGTFNGAQINEIATTFFVDLFGTMVGHVTVTDEMPSGNGAQPGARFVESVNHTGLLNNTTTWCLGKPQSTQWKKSHSDPEYGADIFRTVSRVWDTTACRLDQETIEPGDTNYQVVRDIDYDGFGNISSETVTGAGMAPRTTTTNWGVLGQFPETVTNPLSQTTDPSWDYVLGVPLAMMDPNGITVSWTYDDFGRRTRETRPDGTYTDFVLTDCTSVNNYCGTGYDRVKTKVRSSQKQTNGIEIRYDDTYLDTLDRTVQVEQQMLSGAVSRVRTIYDLLGRVAQVSMPSVWTNPAFYTTAEYDILNRPTQISRQIDAGNGTLQFTSVSYEGLTTTITDPEGKKSTKVMDALGRVFRSIDDIGHYQQFDYDAFGSVLEVTDSASLSSPLLKASYDYGIRAFRRTSNDMDMGNWTYTPNALGEVVAYTDAKGQNFSATFDKLSRPLTRTEPDENTVWTWGTSAAAHNIGRLASVSSSGHSEAYDYDSSARLVKRTITADAIYEIDYEYDSDTGLLEFLRYPESTFGYRLPLKHDYQNGILQTVSQGSYVYWQANATDARGNIIDATLGNGIRTVRSFDAVTGWLSYIQSGIQTDTDRQNMEYLWDKVGNLKQRHDVRRWLTEDFIYDDLHRLDYSLLNQSVNLDLSYDAMGNITSKSDVGGGATWTYHATKKHAVTQAGSSSYGYDDNGNQTTRNGNNVEWTSYNYPKHIENGTEYHDFFYDANRQRWKRDYFDGSATESTIYVGGILEKKIYDGTTEYRHYIYAGGEPLSVYIRRDNGSSNRHIFLKNHQGSIASVTWGGSGGISVNENFTAFGERRDPIDWDGPPSAANISKINQTSERGYTFHSNLEESSLIHMNGRVADGLTGRFLSPDPFVPDPGFTQSFNRYSYVNNNPLSYTDPSGFTPCLGLEIVVCFDVIRTIFGLISGGGGPVPPPPNYCFVAGPSGCYGTAPSKFGKIFDDIFGLPASENGVLGFLDRLSDIYLCTRVMRSPLSCLGGGPLAGVGMPGFGGGGTFGSGPCGEYCLSWTGGTGGWDQLPPESGLDAFFAPWGGWEGFKIAFGCLWQCGLPGNGSLDANLAQFGPIGIAVSGVRATVGSFKLTQTVASHATDIVTKGPFKDELARPFINSPLTIREIMAAGKGVPDLGGVAGALRWEVPGRFRGTQGTWELVVKDDLILHFNFVGK